jgi:hypothetical protein
MQKNDLKSYVLFICLLRHKDHQQLKLMLYYCIALRNIIVIIQQHLFTTTFLNVPIATSVETQDKWHILVLFIEVRNNK